MKTREVIVICEDRIVRVPAHAFNMVMNAAGEMQDDWDDYYCKNGSYSKKQSDAGLDALQKLSAVAV